MKNICGKWFDSGSWKDGMNDREREREKLPWTREER